MAEKRGFKGIWIPAEIWLSEDLSLFEKVLFVEIHSLDNERGCYASNQYFADFFGISPRQIRTYITGLKEKGLIEVTIKNRYDRTIRCKGKYAHIPKPDIDKLMEMKKSIDLSIYRPSRTKNSTRE